MTRPPVSPIFFFAALLLVVALVSPVVAVIAAMPPDEAFRTFARIGGAALRVSLIASAGATLVATLVGVPAGYYLARRPGREFLAGAAACVSAGRFRIDADLRARNEFAVGWMVVGTRAERSRFVTGRRGGGVLRL